MSAQAEEMSDKQLVEQVKTGNKKAFDLLVLKYQHKIISIIGRYVSDSAEAHDVAQEAFIKAYRAIGNFRGDSAFYTWIYRIAINTAKNHLVSRKRRPPARDLDLADVESYGPEAVLSDMQSPESTLATQQLEQAVFQAMSDLPDELRTAVTLRELDGLSYEQIAEVMDCPVGTVRSRIFRARDGIDKRVSELID